MAFGLVNAVTRFDSVPVCGVCLAAGEIFWGGWVGGWFCGELGKGAGMVPGILRLSRLSRVRKRVRKRLRVVVRIVKKVLQFFFRLAKEAENGQIFWD
jgi:hypothetical protein